MHVWTYALAQACPTAIPWTVARQAPLSMEFSRQEYWSGLSFPSSYWSIVGLHCCAVVTFYYSSNWKLMTYIISNATWMKCLSMPHTHTFVLSFSPPADRSLSLRPLPSPLQADAEPWSVSTATVDLAILHRHVCAVTLGLIWKRRMVKRMRSGIARGVCRSPHFPAVWPWASFSTFLSLISQCCKVLESSSLERTGVGTTWDDWYVSSALHGTWHILKQLFQRQQWLCHDSWEDSCPNKHSESYATRGHMREAGGCPGELAFPGTRFPAARPRGQGGSSSSRAGQSEVEGGTSQQTEDWVLLLLVVGLKAKWRGQAPQSRAEDTVSPCPWQLLAFHHNECMHDWAS